MSAMKKRQYPDDDGRTVADMSNVARQPLLFPRPSRRRPPVQADIPGEKAPSEPVELSREEQRWAVLGAVKAALLIALAFLVGLGIVILLFLI